MTTTARQLDELGLSHRLPDVIAETEQVRAELGYPIMVTPFPQMVMSQALFNVIGERRYAQVSDQVVRYCLGKFGKPTSPIDRQVLAVTHLPQVAACADHHLVVAKQLQAGATLSSVSPVQGERRVGEVARMLGGERLSDTTLAHAREMLQARA